MLQSFWMEMLRSSKGSTAGANGIKSGLSNRSRSQPGTRHLRGWRASASIPLSRLESGCRGGNQTAEPLSTDSGCVLAGRRRLKAGRFPARSAAVHPDLARGGPEPARCRGSRHGVLTVPQLPARAQACDGSVHLPCGGRRVAGGARDPACLSVGLAGGLGMPGAPPGDAPGDALGWGGCPAGAVYSYSDNGGSDKMVSCPVRPFPRQCKITRFGEEGAALAQEPFSFHVRWRWAGAGGWFSPP